MKDENYIPIGQDEPKPVKAGEYAYVDDANDIICRLEIRQVEKTKVTLDTKNCFYILQGNRATSKEYLEEAANRLINLTKRFLGGKEHILYIPR
ncbi:hypothetical protein [Thermoanaerobacterium sp. RBIITD]|uniref:hypothetical protein n=1 Tax=Thermoanaerobacterium sp. RBIITD TaxID=1550240 RepID=UPI000BB93248|nr:hypothetical protein [Thermoanaerobacterium sp. RBIITD]